MMIPDNVLYAGGAGGIALLALLIFFAAKWQRRGREAVPKVAAKQEGGFDAVEYLARNTPKVEEPRPVEKREGKELNELLENAMMSAAKNSNLDLEITLPDNTTMTLFGKEGWKIAGKLKIGGEDKPDTEPQKSQEKTEGVS